MNVLQFRFSEQLFRFTQWSRAPYAVFMSLGRMIKIATLMFTYTLLTMQFSFAQTDTLPGKTHDLNEIVISARRTPATYSQLARNISIMDSVALEESPGQSVQDLLEYTSGLDLRQRGTNGVQADLSIRGGSFDQNLILLNGINITDPQTGHHNLNIPVDKQAVDKIEILRGPASRVFGPNAFSGAVNFITGSKNHSSLNAHITGGQHNFLNTGISGNLVTGNVKNFISANYKKSDGYTENTDFDIKKIYYQGQLSTDNGDLEWQLGHNSKNFGANSFYTTAADQYEETQTSFANISYESAKPLHLNPVIYWRRNLDHYILHRDNPSFYQNFHQTNVYGANISTYFNTALGETALGIEARRESILSNSLGEKMDNPKAIPGEDTLKYTNKDLRTNISGYIEQNVTAGNFSLSAGLMINRNTMLEDNFTLFPGLDISYQFNRHFRLYGSANRSLRLPTFTDMYYSGPNNIGNPELKPERSFSTEGGVKYLNHYLNADFSVFNRQGNDIIDWLWLKDKEKWHTENITELNTTGFETSVSVKPKNIFGGDFPVNILSVSYNYLNINKQNDTEIISHYAMDHLKHKVMFHLNHQVTEKISLDWHANYQDREGSYLNYNPETETETNKSYKPYWRIDARASYTHKWFTAYIEATNLTDSEYHDNGSVPQPGRWIKAGLKADIDFK